MPRSLPLSVCMPYQPTDFDPGYKYHLIATEQPTVSGCACPPSPFLLDGICLRMEFRGLVVRRDYSFHLLFGHSTTTAFHKSLKLADEGLLQIPQVATPRESHAIEWDDDYLYDFMTDLPWVEPYTKGRYLLEGASIRTVHARLQTNGRMEVVEAIGQYHCLTHKLGRRCLPEVSACL
jgi:hypothetical protein